MNRALRLVPDEAAALIWAPWRMLESDHSDFKVELRELERLLKRYASQKSCPPSLLGRIDRFIRHFESHMGAHFKAEEKAVFPFLQRHAPHLKEVLLILIAEHAQIRQTLAAWKRSFRKAKSHVARRGQEIPSQARGLELVRLVRAHVDGETRIMQQFALKAA